MRKPKNVRIAVASAVLVSAANEVTEKDTRESLTERLSSVAKNSSFKDNPGSLVGALSSYLNSNAKFLVEIVQGLDPVKVKLLRKIFPKPEKRVFSKDEMGL